MTERGQQVRLVLVVAALVAAWTGLSLRLAFLHLDDNNGLRDRIQRIREIEQPILVGRGRILDRNGNIMALDLAVKNVFVDPKTILDNGHPRFIGAQLGRLLEMDPAMISSRINRPGRRFEYIKKFVTEDKAREIAGLQMPGVHFEDISTRYYPRSALMSHVVGFSNEEGVGSAGMEQRLDKYLRGVPGLTISEVDGRRHEVYTRRTLEIQPQQGADVYLTLDQNLQYFVERTLDAAMEQHRAKSAWAIMERVKTGEILAMACRPTFDLNQYRTAPDESRLNRPIGYIYEPGSTFKIAVISAALNEGVTSPRVVVFCENGVWTFKGKPLHDYHPYGNLCVADVLKKSSNIGAAKIALMLGEEKFYSYLKDFGIGSRTGVSIPGEEGGILNPRSKWTSLSLSRMAMGHEVAVTSLQMLNLLCTIANEGFQMKPLAVQRVVSTDGKTIMQPQPEVVSRPIRADTAHLMCKLLTRVTEEGGTGTKARIDGFRVAGKTGTAQKPVPGGYSDSANIASFMGVVPAEAPEIGIIVVVDEPQPLHTGGQVAAPLFKEIAEQAVHYLDIPPVPEDRAFRFGDTIPTADL